MHPHRRASMCEHACGLPVHVRPSCVDVGVAVPLFRRHRCQGDVEYVAAQDLQKTCRSQSGPRNQSGHEITFTQLAHWVSLKPGTGTTTFAPNNLVVTSIFMSFDPKRK